jgi:hypothetical protein
MRVLITIWLFLAGCDGGTVIVPPTRPTVVYKTDTVQVIVRDTVTLNDTVYLPQQYVMIRSCVTGHDPYYYDTAVYNKEFPLSTTVYDSALLPRLREYAEKIAVRTVVRDTITFTDGKFFWPSHLCNCWGCLDSLRIEKIN